MIKLPTTSAADRRSKQRTLPSGPGSAPVQHVALVYSTPTYLPRSFLSPPPSLPAQQASPQLFALLVTGKHSAEAVITERRPGANIMEPIKVRMTDVKVASIADLPSTAPAGYPPDEEITLSFATFEISFAPQKADGSLGTPICSCWNKLVATSCACRVAG
ncbi:hypothetical protein COHA_009741 [Chlorella ohadii]|uniref:Uncharacterized protein n=1 Tax=Chlorella ohadii TaxID=2649997 RepID=A0AAD5H1X8_9CHLO|nr:hypothetical protein COHA_009741 [Chlorella ohadii]